MIFLTLGTQLPFDRLVRAVDAWAAAPGRPALFGQIADPGPEGYRPAHFEWARFLEPAEVEARFDAAPFVIGHAGMGTIISALGRGKPLLVMPRRAHLGEQRNDHQLATARRFGERPGVEVAMEPEEVAPALDRLAAGGGETGARIGPFAEDRLIAAVRAVLTGDKGASGS